MTRTLIRPHLIHRASKETIAARRRTIHFLSALVPKELTDQLVKMNARSEYESIKETVLIPPLEREELVRCDDVPQEYVDLFIGLAGKTPSKIDGPDFDPAADEEVAEDIYNLRYALAMDWYSILGYTNTPSEGTCTLDDQLLPKTPLSAFPDYDTWTLQGIRTWEELVTFNSCRLLSENEVFQLFKAFTDALKAAAESGPSCRLVFPDGLVLHNSSEGWLLTFPPKS